MGAESTAAVAEAPAAHVDIAGNGPAVLLLHGWGASAELMAPVAAALGDKHRCIAPDFPGFGATATPDVAWGVDDYVRWTLALLDRLGVDSVDVVAHSHGARVAMKLAVAAPSRVGKLVLTGAAGIRVPPTPRQRVKRRVFRVGRTLATTPAVPTPLRRRLQTWSERQGSVDYRAATGVMRATLVKVVNEDLRPLFARIAAPTLLVWGDADAETPLAWGRIMESEIPDAGLVILEGGSHFAYLEQGQHFSHIVATFLGDIA